MTSFSPMFNLDAEGPRGYYSFISSIGFWSCWREAFRFSLFIYFFSFFTSQKKPFSIRTIYSLHIRIHRRDFFFFFREMITIWVGKDSFKISLTMMPRLLHRWRPLLRRQRVSSYLCTNSTVFIYFFFFFFPSTSFFLRPVFTRWNLTFSLHYFHLNTFRSKF